MDEKMKVFEFSGMKLRAIIVEGDPWFVAKDVCDVLELKVQDSVRYLDDEEKSYTSRERVGMPPGRPVVIINESGLYSLILKSRKPEAKTFQKWVTRVVLPAIRKTGGYILNEEDVEDPEELMARALLIARNKMDFLEKKNKDLTRLVPVYAYLGIKPSHSLSMRVGRQAARTCRSQGINNLNVKQGYRANHYPIEVLEVVVSNIGQRYKNA